MMHGRGKSDEAIVARKPANKAERSAAEPVERRAEAEGNASQSSTGRVQSRGAVSQGLERIRQAARERKKEKFIGFSYGFRPGRGAHDAMDALVVAIEHRRVNFILDADIRSFFDTVSQDWLIRFVEHRVGDPRVIRLIRKWLKAGVLEDGVVNVSDRGTGQGAVISPLLANIYLHYALDLWVEQI